MDPVTILMGLAQFAPQLVRWATGNEKAEQVAAVAVDVAQKVAGVPAGGDYIGKLKADAELAAKYADAIAQREHDLSIAYLADIDSARKMQIAALQQDDVFSKRFIYYFAIGWSIFAALYFTAVTFQWFGGVAPAGQRMADTILGVLIGTVITGFFQFFYGSNSRSQKKDEVIAKMVAK